MRLRLALLAAGLVIAAGCNAPAATPARTTAAGTPRPFPTVARQPSPSPVASQGTAAGPELPEALIEQFPRTKFSNPTKVDNAWLPYQPGNHWVTTGQATVDGKRINRRVELTITNVTKVVDDITTFVAYELDFNDDVLVESELIFLAEDDSGTLWQLGQYPEEYEGREIAASPIWLAGQDGAAAGVFMYGNPGFTARSYSQGYGPAVGWADRARVFETGSETCVPAGCYHGVLVINEFSRDQPDAHQLKYYAKGVGLVRVGWAGALEPEQEVLELTSFEHLSSAGLATASAAALAQDARGYERSPGLYAKTAHAEVAP